MPMPYTFWFLGFGERVLQVNVSAYSANWKLYNVHFFAKWKIQINITILTVKRY